MENQTLSEKDLLISRIIGVSLITFSLYLLKQAYINYTKK
jgi:hypothetical protein